MVGLDIDGVVADFLSPFLLRLERRIGKGPIPAESLRGVRLSAHPVLTEDAVRECAEAVRQDPGFWDGLDSLLSPDQWRRLEHLSECGQLSFINAPDRARELGHPRGHLRVVSAARHHEPRRLPGREGEVGRSREARRGAVRRRQLTRTARTWRNVPKPGC